MTRVRRRNRQRGVTLVELMISMVIVSIAVAAALSVGATMVDGMRTHRRLVSTERSARVSLDYIANVIRNSSAGVPSNNITDLVGCSNFGSTARALNVVNNPGGPDELEVIYASGGVVAGLATTYNSTSTTVRAVKGVAFPTADQVQVGDLLIITNITTGHLVRVTSVSDGGATWNLGTVAPASSGCVPNNMPASGYESGALVLRAKIARFFVAPIGGVAGAVPTLFLDPDGDGPAAPEPLAEGVEDFQIAVGIDTNGDGVLTDTNSNTDEWFYNTSGDILPAGVPRAIRMTIVSRSVGGSDTRAKSIRPTVEDHGGAAVADQYRRRILSTVIEIRNLEGSP